MICVVANVSGPQLAGEFRDDPEEFLWMLDDMAENVTKEFLTEVADHSAGLTAVNVAEFLRTLATAIENRD